MRWDSPHGDEEKKSKKDLEISDGTIKMMSLGLLLTSNYELLPGARVRMLSSGTWLHGREFPCSSYFSIIWSYSNNNQCAWNNSVRILCSFESIYMLFLPFFQHKWVHHWNLNFFSINNSTSIHEAHHYFFIASLHQLIYLNNDKSIWKYVPTQENKLKIQQVIYFLNFSIK